MKVALCCIIKNENLYLQEYVEYYKNIGFSKIFLYDNNDIDGEKPEDVIQKYVDEKFVEIIDYRGKYSCQTAAYQECYNNHNTDFDWIAFFDCDEFINLKNYADINMFLSDPKFDYFVCILINWEMYTDNDKLYYENKPVQERFTQKLYKMSIRNASRKTIMRCVPNNYLNWDLNVPYNTPALPGMLFNINGSLPLLTSNTLGNNTPPVDWIYVPIDDYLKSPVLKHYFTKSTEEYVYKRLRLYPDGKLDINKLNWEEIVNQYFEINEFSMKKYRIIQKIVNDFYGENKL